MKVQSNYLKDNRLVFNAIGDDFEKDEASLVLCFGEKDLIAGDCLIDMMRATYPNAQVVMASTAGEIYNGSVQENSVSISALNFDLVEIEARNVNIKDFNGDSSKAGKALIEKFAKNDLTYVMVISDGSLVNGSKLIAAINDSLPEKVSVSGGMAADGDRFESTLVGLNSIPEEGNIVAIGFYGPLKVSHASYGGWETFGLEKKVTKSEENVLYEINGQSALKTYKEYLGPHAKNLPGSALLFPLNVKFNSGVELVRTILSIDEENQSMVFAGDIPVGSTVRFMRSSLDKLIDAAGQAAEASLIFNNRSNPKFGLLVSCVGRKLVLSQRVEEEIEAIREYYDWRTSLIGFYSYGEFSPLEKETACQLHNQTMTITTLDE